MNDTGDSTVDLKRRALWAALFTIALGASAAGRGDERPPAPGGREEAGGESSRRKQRDEFVSGVEKDLAAARERLDRMKRDASRASGKARADLQGALRSLERQHRAVRSRLARLKAATAERWTSLEDGVRTDLNRLKQSLRKHEKDAT